MRKCGDCTLCCRLLPVRELAKGAGVRCQHQKVGKGCTIYASRPLSCRLWNCVWLDGEDTPLRRPDRCHVVVDSQLDYVTALPDSGERVDIAVIQVWVDPRFPDAHRDPGLRAWLAQMGEEKGLAAMIRYNASDGFALFPPSMTPTGEFVENEGTGVRGPEHSFADRMTTLARLNQ